MDIKAVAIVGVFSGLLFSVTGCHSRSGLIAIHGEDKQAQHHAELKLAEAATSVSRSLAELAEIEKSAHPRTKPFSPVDPKLVGMDQLTSVDWSGPIEPLVKRLAQVAGYKVQVLGRRPSIPVLVSIAAKSTSVADLLRDLNFQGGSRANLEIYPASKIVELRYGRP